MKMDSYFDSYERNLDIDTAILILLAAAVCLIAWRVMTGGVL